MEIVGLDSIFNSCYFCCFNLYVWGLWNRDNLTGCFAQLTAFIFYMQKNQKNIIVWFIQKKHLIRQVYVTGISLSFDVHRDYHLWNVSYHCGCYYYCACHACDLCCGCAGLGCYLPSMGYLEQTWFGIFVLFLELYKIYAASVYLWCLLLLCLSRRSWVGFFFCKKEPSSWCASSSAASRSKSDQSFPDSSSEPSSVGYTNCEYFLWYVLKKSTIIMESDKFTITILIAFIFWCFRIIFAVIVWFFFTVHVRRLLQNRKLFVITNQRE